MTVHIHDRHIQYVAFASCNILNTHCLCTFCRLLSLVCLSVLYLVISRELAPPNGNAIENILLVMDKTRNSKREDNEHQPRKLNTKKWSRTEPTTKSANALSGDTSLNRARFVTLTCERNDAVSTNWPTVLANPARKALKGKLVTSTQYTNWMTPVRTRNTRKASTSFKREGVVLRYAAQNVCRATFDADVAAEEEVDDVEATVGAFARLDALAVL